VFIGTEQEAMAELEGLVAYNAEPTLSYPELQRLLAGARRADRSGRAPADEGWEGAWDLNAAAARGWEMKAGKAAEYQGEERTISQHCATMADRFASRMMVSVPTRSRSR